MVDAALLVTDVLLEAALLGRWSVAVTKPSLRLLVRRTPVRGPLVPSAGTVDSI